MNEEAESEYQSTLDYETKKFYKEKLSLEGEQIPDPSQGRSKQFRVVRPKWNVLNIIAY